MSLAIRVLAITVLSAISFNKVQACTCAVGDGPACQEAWRQSVDAVFLGRVEKIESIQGVVRVAPGAMSMTPMGGLLRVMVAVEEAYRGVSEKTIQLYTAENSAACGYSFQQGERYLIFASKTPDAQLMVSLCSATRPAKYAEEDIAYLRSIPSLPPTATIKGSVWRYTHDPNFKPKFEPSLMDHYRPPEQDYMAMAPEPGLSVIATSKDGTEHAATVNPDGSWRISGLPPGAYTVHPQTKEATFVHPFIANIEVAPRGCAEVNIRVESNGRISGTLEHRPPASDWALIKIFVLPFPNPDWHHPTMEKTLELDASAFEIGPLPPGRYVLGAYLVVKLNTLNGYTYSDLGRNYFPGVFDPNLAQPLDVSESKAVTNVRFRAIF